MFTGIIQSLGHIQSIQSLDEGVEWEVATEPDILNELAIGDSISINGVCSTAIKKSESSFFIQYLPETLTKSTFHNAHAGDKLNLELSLRPSDRLGGHFVSGHVDSTGRISKIELGDEVGWIYVDFDPTFAPYLIPKGSIAIDGISLTVVDIQQNTFSCSLISHTMTQTILHQKTTNDLVNLEYDMIGKYLYSFYQKGQGNDA